VELPSVYFWLGRVPSILGLADLGFRVSTLLHDSILFHAVLRRILIFYDVEERGEEERMRREATIS
jgi:hypothetical protein